VYDVSSYVEEHPGGDAILNNAGGDSTKEFFGCERGSSGF
jgi:cytochrome b involved in lipid metabolism